ncbi:MAG: hypothetical protein KAX15_00005 [Candidatus Omnitrophica bacterium]|nr:hypothetical protein [Candidatus Omnitrophota bacterium]
MKEKVNDNKCNNHQVKNNPHRHLPGLRFKFKVLRNEVIKPGVTAVNITPLEPFFLRKKHSFSHGSRKHLTPRLLFDRIPGIGTRKVSVFFLLAVASPENNGLAELLSDFNADGDPCIKSFVRPFVMRKNSDQAGFSAEASPVVTDNLASARLVWPEEGTLWR